MKAEDLADALTRIDAAIQEKKIRFGNVSMAGEVKCPACGDLIDWSRVVNPKRTGRQRQILGFKCRTENCIRGGGH
jgi:uncharacterized protein (UPF0212 family)